MQNRASLTRKYLGISGEDYCVIVTQVSFFGDTGVNLMQNAFDSPLTLMSEEHDTDVSTQREVLSCS